jgi:hypothetical protein
MGQSTNLYLNTKWDFDVIKDVIERLHGEVKVRTYESIPSMVNIDLPKLKRSMYIHFSASTPIGTMTLLSMGANEQGQEIMRSIAKCLGGLVMDNDCDAELEMIQGSTSTEDSTPYFVNYAITHDGIDPDDIEGILKSRQKWYKEIEHKDIGLTENTRPDKYKD